MSEVRTALITEHEATDGTSANREAIEAIKVWVLNYTTNFLALINLDDIFRADDFDPTDGDMYDAVSEMVRDGILDGPDPHTVHLPRHTDYEYTRVPRAGDKCTMQVGSDSYVWDITSVTSGAKTFVVRSEGGVSQEGVRRRRDGRYRTAGKHGLLVYPGLAKDHRDPSF